MSFKAAAVQRPQQPSSIAVLQLKKEAANSLKASEQSAEAQQKAASKQWGSTKGSAKSAAQTAWDSAQKARNEVGKPVSIVFLLQILERGYRGAILSTECSTWCS